MAIKYLKDKNGNKFSPVTQADSVFMTDKESIEHKLTQGIVNNADMLDGKHSSAFADATHTHSNYAEVTHTHSKSEIGLGNVDNTADSSKSVANSVKWNGKTISIIAKSSLPETKNANTIYFAY